MASGWMTRLLDTGNEGTLALALALGHELGIFQVIMASPEPMTQAEIAEKGGLKERYVQEWLGCMVAGEVIQMNSESPERYFIAEDHKGVMDKIGISARLFASYAVRYDAVKACFRKDGPYGVSHSDYPDIFNVFHVMRESTAAHSVDTMVTVVGGLAEKLDEGIDMVDFGCGTGVLVLELARRYPNSRFHGSDISTQGISIARHHLAESGLKNVTFSCDDLLHLPAHFYSHYDWVLTYDVIHDLSEPLKALNEISKCLKDGGVYVIGDIHTPHDRSSIAGDAATMGLYGLSTFLCLPASAGEGGILGPGAAWSVEDAHALIGQSQLEVVHTSTKQPYFAYHVCQKRRTVPSGKGDAECSS
ncbi:S-adenosylmethionine-dependent methyltransferase Rv2258c-like [Babylonia areolata]|uniref:S-adenosylmethionine-dependent methyltransferase Rv2258c-like n=1 Tax=Babylonia areolata TaxID=304850 RepID=UPI003FD128B2